MRRLLILAAVVWTAASCGAEPVSFSDIKGTHRAAGDVWQLALSGPADGGVITKQRDLALSAYRPTPLVDVPDHLSGKELTVLLDLADVTGGLLRLKSPVAPDDARTVMISRSGWVAVRFGPAIWEGNVTLSVCATSPVRIKQVTVYRTFAQLFGSGGRVDLLGAVYHKLGDDEIIAYPLLPAAYRHHRTGQWNRPPWGCEDGITGVRLDKSYQSFFVGPLQDEVGLDVPVRAPNGVVLCGRMKGHFAFITYPEQAKYILAWKGDAQEWSVPVIHLDGAVLDGSGNGIFAGKHKHHWAQAKTWVDNYGTGFLDFVVMLPQNEIPVSIPGATRFMFEYEASKGMKTFQLSLPAGTEGVALVNAGSSRTEVLLHSQGGYTPAGVIEDSRYPDRLAVKAGAIRLER